MASLSILQSNGAASFTHPKSGIPTVSVNMFDLIGTVDCIWLKEKEIQTHRRELHGYQRSHFPSEA